MDSLVQSIHHFNIDTQKILNLDETDMSLKRNSQCSSKKKAFVQAGVQCHVRVSDFYSIINRLMLLGTINS